MSLLDLLGRRKKRRENGADPFRIEERGGEKVFKYEGITYSKLKGADIYTHEYWDYFIPVAYAFDNPRVLLIGLGGGTVALQLATLLRGRIDLDVVESSRRAVELSHEFAPAAEANIIIGEGSAYVATTNKRYDAMLLDAYVSTSIPKQFLERRFIEDAHNTLSGDGILAINYAMGFMGFVRFNEYVAKLRERFLVYRIGTALTEANVIILCSKSMNKEKMLDRIEQRMRRNRENAFLFRSYEAMREL